MSDDWQDWTDDDDLWEGGQPPPDGYTGDSDDYTDDGNEEDEGSHPLGPENLPAAGEEFIGGYPDEIKDAWDYLVDLDDVDTKNIRGVGFADIYECFSWMESVGVLGFSSIVNIGGIYFPAIGEYEDTDDGDPGGDDDYDREIDLLDLFFS